MISRRTVGWLGAATIAAVFLGIVFLGSSKNYVTLPDGANLEFTEVARGGWHSFDQSHRFRNYLVKTLPPSIVETLGIQKYTRGFGVKVETNSLSFFFVLHRRRLHSEEEDSYWYQSYRLQVSDDGKTWIPASSGKRLSCDWVWVWQTPPEFKGKILHMQLQTQKGTNWIETGTFSVQNPLNTTRFLSAIERSRPR